jgi:heme oxygenase
MILKRLKLATSASHSALEEKLPLMNADLSRQAYCRFVARFFGFYAPLEAQLMASPHWQQLPFDYADRQKTPRLTQDLLALGTTPTALSATPLCAALPPLHAPEQLLGCLYVIEGATLGGRSITQHLHTKLGLTPQSGGAFFDGYGTQTGSRWKAFCTMLMNNADHPDHPNHPIDESRHAAIVAAADSTFQTLTQWLFPTSPQQSDAHEPQSA